MTNKIEINGWKYSPDDLEIGKFDDGNYYVLTNLQKPYISYINENFELIYTHNTKRVSRFVTGFIDRRNIKITDRIRNADFHATYRHMLINDIGTGLSSSDYIVLPLESINTARVLGFMESFTDGNFYHNSLSPNPSHLVRKSVVKKYNFTSKYTVSEYGEDYTNEVKAARDSNKISIERDFLIFYNKYLKNYSFGVELEYCLGFLRRQHYEDNGFIGLRDGSVSSTGSELASLPIFNAKDFYHVKMMTEILKERCDFDKTCSVHIHIGSLRHDNEFIVSMYKVFRQIQDELYTYFPYNRLHGNGDKIYCKKLPEMNLNISSKNYKSDLKKAVENIFKLINKGKGFKAYEEKFKLVQVKDGLKAKKQFSYFSKTSQKNSYEGTHKWNIDARYYGLNFFNFFFTNYKTLEFRIKEGSDDFDSILNWVSIYVAIIRYAENLNPSCSVDNLDLEEIIKSYYPRNIAEKLMKYLAIRRKVFTSNKEGWRNPKQLENFKIY